MATVVRKKIVKDAGQPVDELEEQVAQVREGMMPPAELEARTPMAGSMLW